MQGTKLFKIFALDDFVLKLGLQLIQDKSTRPSSKTTLQNIRTSDILVPCCGFSLILESNSYDVSMNALVSLQFETNVEHCELILLRHFPYCDSFYCCCNFLVFALFSECDKTVIMASMCVD